MINTLWQFIRGDMKTADFTAWLYANEEIELFLGADLYLDTVSTNFENKNDVENLKQILADYLI